MHAIPHRCLLLVRRGAPGINLSCRSFCSTSSILTRTPPAAMSAWDRAALTLCAATTALIDPARGDMIALLGELTGTPALRALHRRMKADPEGAAILREKPRIRRSQLDVTALSKLPRGSFGAEYARYLTAYGFDPDERHEVHHVGDPELAYVLQRYREVHDFWHVLAGLPPSVLGETALKWLEMVQTGLPMCALSALVAPVRMNAQERHMLFTRYAPWAATTGRDAVFLLAVRYEAHFGTPLEALRSQLRFTPAPQLPA